MRCFENLIVIYYSILYNVLYFIMKIYIFSFIDDVGIIDYLLYNVFYCIMQIFSLICRYKHSWSNHIKISYTVYVIVLFLYYLIKLVSIKPSAGTTPCLKKYFLPF